MLSITRVSQLSASYNAAARRSRNRRFFVALLVAALAALLLALVPQRAHAAPATSGSPKSYYLALGDSLAFGYQPNLNWSNGYAQQWYSSDLKTKGVTSFTNYGCNGETSSTFIHGGCPYWYLAHNYHTGSQLSAAVRFIKGHAGKVSPVSLDIGANDLLPDINTSTCQVSNWDANFATFKSNFTGTILPQLTTALTSTGLPTQDLVIMNYYDPFIQKCPQDTPYVDQLNTFVSEQATAFGATLADVYDAFGGANQGANICSLTWICDAQYHDIHATTSGYAVIAGAYKAAFGY